jgi:hypothetical protein
MTVVWPHMDIISHHSNDYSIFYMHINDNQFEIIPKKNTEQFLKHKILGLLLRGENLAQI